jgi:hypothetical protein
VTSVEQRGSATELLLGIVRILFAVVRLFGFRLDSQRVASGETKSSILAAVERAKKRILWYQETPPVAQAGFYRRGWVHPATKKAEMLDVSLIDSASPCRSRASCTQGQ